MAKYVRAHLYSPPCYSLRMKVDVETSSPLGMLALMSVRGVGPQAARKLSGRFATVGELQSASSSTLATMVGAAVLAALVDRQVWEKALAKAEDTLDAASRHRVRVLSATDEEYPTWLRLLPDRPPVLYVRGHLRPGKRYVASIGTREPSKFGEEVTRRIVTELGKHNWSIVSGLALGIDTLSHRAALDCGAHTVAVLANGLESVYPKKNTALADEILEAGGALVSEQPIGTPAIPRHLVQRDRLQSGMSAGTVVMQTDIVGGSMHTVRFTLMQERLLFAPLPKGRHAEEAKSRGILALTQMPARELADKLDAEGDYATKLRREFGDSPVARAIEGRDDYQETLAALERAADSASATVSRAPQLKLL